MMLPKGFYSLGKNIGIKDTTKDFAVIYSNNPCHSAAVFTLNNFPGAPIIIGKEHIKNGILQAIVINSKNSNVATGEEGIKNSLEICKAVAISLEINYEDVLPSSTGVIGVPLPIDKILNACKTIKSELQEGNLEEVAEAILTTDKKKKISYKVINQNGKKGVIYGIAKGAGMIEPNMATMLCYILTDIKIKTSDLKTILKKAVDKSFNCLTIDSDTSTSDTVVIMSNGTTIELEEDEFEEYLIEICIDLTKQIAMDAEGATKLIELKVSGAKTLVQAKKIGKSILNSPLVKTAIYGGDPNWGRFIMAIGKVFDEKIPFDSISLKLNGFEIKNADDFTKKKMSSYLKDNSNIFLDVNLGLGEFSSVFWGCDLSEEYIKENAYYTT
ncbi:MAG: bifunctional glutamate N-acetyltransferase/amino-acid acetyltransferase ArgJ [Spirochaetia bacterium]|nr:bifunctional glutamate N-acetyltransferase/amino-acid acetyltransferase ArgJ [Spirochaetia bacterium]